MTDTSRLGAIVGGKTLSKDDARALWQRFSEYMDANRNDFAGFAKREGFAFASVAAHAGVATLTLSNEQPSAAPRRLGRDGGPKSGGPKSGGPKSGGPSQKRRG